MGSAYRRPTDSTSRAAHVTGMRRTPTPAEGEALSVGSSRLIRPYVTASAGHPACGATAGSAWSHSRSSSHRRHCILPCTYSAWYSRPCDHTRRLPRENCMVKRVPAHSIAPIAVTVSRDRMTCAHSTIHVEPHVWRDAATPATQRAHPADDDARPVAAA